LPCPRSASRAHVHSPRSTPRLQGWPSRPDPVMTGEDPSGTSSPGTGNFSAVHPVETRNAELETIYVIMQKSLDLGYSTQKHELVPDNNRLHGVQSFLRS